jgi:type II secretory pathway pseudopilin PulG
MMTTTTATETTRSESGMTLLAVMAIMTLFAIALLAVAPSVQQEVQREKELEAIRRGEEVAYAIQQYVTFYRGTKLPTSMDDLLEGLPQGTKKRQILRPSAAIDPLSEDGKWRLIKPEPQVIARFAKRVQDFNNGLLPGNPTPLLDKYIVVIVNSINTNSDSDIGDVDEDYDVVTDNTPFIGVASQSKSKSVVSYYGLENHSKWVFTPLFRGSGRNVYVPRPQLPGRNQIIQE